MELEKELVKRTYLVEEVVSYKISRLTVTKDDSIIENFPVVDSQLKADLLIARLTEADLEKGYHIVVKNKSF